MTDGGAGQDTDEMAAEHAAEALSMAEKGASPVYVVIQDQKAGADARRITYEASPPEYMPCIVAAPGDTPRIVADRIARLLNS